MLRSAFDAVDGFGTSRTARTRPSSTTCWKRVFAAGARAVTGLTHRHQGNTWRAPPGYFLSRARAQRPARARLGDGRPACGER